MQSFDCRNVLWVLIVFDYLYPIKPNHAIGFNKEGYTTKGADIDMFTETISAPYQDLFNIIIIWL